MIAARGFYCLWEKKKYNEGDKYTGSRKDLGNFLKDEPKKRKPRKTKKK